MASGGDVSEQGSSAARRLSYIFPNCCFSTCQFANHGIFKVQRLFALHNPKKLSVKSGREKRKKPAWVQFSFFKVWRSKCGWWGEARPGWDGKRSLQLSRH